MRRLLNRILLLNRKSICVSSDEAIHRSRSRPSTCRLTAIAVLDAATQPVVMNGGQFPLRQREAAETDAAGAQAGYFSRRCLDYFRLVNCCAAARRSKRDNHIDTLVEPSRDHLFFVENRALHKSRGKIGQGRRYQKCDDCSQPP
jgi:hypothetical protein